MFWFDLADSQNSPTITLGVRVKGDWETVTHFKLEMSQVIGCI